MKELIKNNTVASINATYAVAPKKVLGFLTVLVVLVAVLSGCSQPLQGKLDKDMYYAPQKAYGFNVRNKIFRGEVDIDERCDQTGGSTTFFDAMDRVFRIDYLKINENPLAQVPDLASDETLLEGVVNTYLREVLGTSPNMVDSDIVHREFIDQYNENKLYVVAMMNLKSLNDKQAAMKMDGQFYYAFMAFRRGDFVYLIQHQQTSPLIDQTRDILNVLKNEMQVPGQPDKHKKKRNRYTQGIGNFFTSVGLYKSHDNKLCE